MENNDEMDRKIKLLAQEISYRIMLLVLSIWMLYNCWQTLANGEKYNLLPGLILCLAVCIQSVSEMVIKRKIIEGENEYRKFNELIWGILVGCLVVASILIFVGSFIISRT